MDPVSCPRFCTHPRNSADLETLIANADIALYRAKQSGGNTYRIYLDVPYCDEDYMRLEGDTP
ncbi:MAG: hypothetical protein ACHBMF_06280, partial [Chromatiales bacterium]